MDFDAHERRRVRTQRLPPRRGRVKIAVFKKLLELASLAVSRISGRAARERRGRGPPGDGAGPGPGPGPAEDRRRGRRVRDVPDSAVPMPV